MKNDKNIQAFFALVRAGLWADVESSNLRNHGFVESVDWEEVYQMSEEQSVIGLVLAGIETSKVKPPQELLLQWIGEVQMLEQQNKAMNQFINRMFDELKKNDIDSVLIKGQAIAQCYEKPLWRCSGDIDLLLNAENYEKGKKFLANLSETEPKEYSFNKEYITSIKGWCVELHGSLRCGLSASLNKGVDDIQQLICDNHHVRYWDNDGKKIPLPEENDDVLVIFTHYIKHFYKGGLGIRQICDWCRLLWTYRDSLNHGLLESWIRKMGLMQEWKAFASYAVDFLGMPVEAMPLYDDSSKWKRKAEKIQTFIVKSGNFGHNEDGSYFTKYPFIVRKTISMYKRVGALLQHAQIFPMRTLIYLPHVISTGLWSAAKGE